MLSKVQTWLHTARGAPDVLRAALIEADREGTGYVTKHQLHAALKSAGLPLGLHEVLTLVRHLGADRQGVALELLAV